MVLRTRGQRFRRVRNVVSPRATAAVREAVAGALGAPVLAKSVVGAPDDAREREADWVADRVMATPEGAAMDEDATPGASDAGAGGTTHEPEPEEVRRKSRENGPVVAGNAGPTASAGPGRPLPASERSFFEPRLGAELGAVRIHTDTQAAGLADRISARAFASGSHVFFAAGEYQPGNTAGRHLLAHELAHVLQQDRPAAAEPTPQVRRKLALRPPGKGERSAFGRAQEFVDRLNKVSPAIEYTLKGQDLSYAVKDPANLTHFDRRMMDFIDRAALVPMRLINHEGRVGGGNLFADSFIAAYVDLDDLLADDLYSFQSDLLHFLTERFQVKDYDRKVGTNFSGEFPKAHRAGKDAEAEQLRALFKDPSIVFAYEETRPNDTWVNAFKSKKHGYFVFQVVKRSDKAIAGGEMWVRRKDGSRASMDDFRKERARAP